MGSRPTKPEFPTKAKRNTSRQLYRLPRKTIFKASAQCRIQKKNTDRMNRIIFWIMNSKIFKKLMALGWRKQLEWDSSATKNADLEEGQLQDDVQGSSYIPQSSVRSDVSYGLSGEPPQRGSSHTAGEPVADSTANGDGPGTEMASHSETIHSKRDISMRSLQHPEQLPLTAPYLDIFTYQNDHGEEGTAMSLTRDLIWELNTVFHCDTKLATYSKKIKEIKQQQLELASMVFEIRQQLDALTSDQDPAPQLEHLEEANKIKGHLDIELHTWTKKMRKVEKEAEMPRSMMYDELKEVLSRHNLLETIPSTPSPTPSRPASPPRKPKTPTASEAEQYAAEDAREEARDMKMKMEIRLQDAREKIENWEGFYEREYKEYKMLVGEGTVTASKTEFDVILLGQQRQASRQLIEAEQDFEMAKDVCRDLGVVFGDPEQESQFLDRADDGYRLSLEDDMVRHVDRGRIEKWMDGAGKEDKANHSTECDDWDSRTVELYDSVSVVAEGKDKERIRRWRALCEEHRVVIPVGLDDVVEDGG